MRVNDSARRVQRSHETERSNTRNSTERQSGSSSSQPVSQAAHRYHADGMDRPRAALVSKGYMSREDMATGPGTFGSKTETALKRMQQANGLPADPSVPPAGLRRGMESGQVLQLQNNLVKLGDLSQQQVNTGPGMYGPQTERAVKDLQVRNGLPTTGEFNEATRAAMQKELGQYKDPSLLVKDTYGKMLGREPTEAELSAATARAEQLKQGGSSLAAMRQDLAGAIRQTDEYRAAHPVGNGAVNNVQDANQYFMTQWGGTPYNGANGAPYGYSDCGPTSTLMALSSLGLMERPGPQGASAAIDAVRDAALGYDSNQSRPMGFGALQQAVTAYGGQSRMLGGGVNGIDEAIARGNPVVIGGNPWQAWGAEQRANGNYLNSKDPGGHFVTVLGKTPEGKYLVGDPLVKGGAIEVTREQLESFFAKDGFGAMEVYRP
jgi:hypothetical protein